MDLQYEKTPLEEAKEAGELARTETEAMLAPYIGRGITTEQASTIAIGEKARATVNHIAQNSSLE